MFCSIFERVVKSKSLNLDLHFPPHYLTTRTSPLGSMDSSESSAGRRDPSTLARGSHAPGSVLARGGHAPPPRLLPTSTGSVFWWIRRFLDGAPPPLTGPLIVGFYYCLVFCFFRLDLADYLLHVQGLLIFYGFLA
jgi:hypothetical protein